MPIKLSVFPVSNAWHVGVVSILAVFCSACGMNLRPEPLGVEARLAGQWQLQTPQREALAATLRAEMAKAQAKQDKRDKRRYPGNPGGTEGEPPPGAGANSPNDPSAERPGGRGNNWEARERREQQEALLNSLLPSNKLQITQSATRIELQPDAGAHRRFDTGVRSTLVSNFATFLIESGWQADVFVVHSKDAEQSIDIVERYRRKDASHLQLQVTIDLPNAKQQMFTAEYALSSP